MIEYIAETGSTNADLLSRASAGGRTPEGYWLVADKQVSGRGRQGRDWFDSSGNFMGSTIVHRSPNDPPAQSLALLAGLALYEVCILFCPDPTRLSLKWPNDLLLGRAKTAGILLEAPAPASGVISGQSGGKAEEQSVVIGIGVNLAAAPKLPDRETAHFASLGPVPSRNDFADMLAGQFETELERWRTYGMELIIRRWLSAAHPAGTPLSVHDAGAQLQQGSFAGLSDDGALLLRLADGGIRAIHAGDVILS